MNPFLTLNKRKGKPVLVVQYREGGTREKAYPLTAEGCRQAGADLYAAGETTWQHSSSTDFPRDYQKGFRGDVHDYIDQGYKAAATKAEAPRVRVIDKMLVWCSMEQFQQSLTAAEKEAFAKIKHEYHNRDQ